MKYLDFENEKYEKGFEPFIINKKNVQENKGRTIVYIRKCDIDVYRGFVSPKYGTLDSARYSTLFLDKGNNQVNIRDIIECGIKSL